MPRQTLTPAQLDEIRAIAPIAADAADFEKYGQDWSGLLEPHPSVIVFPRSTEEVSKLLKYCSDRNLRVVPSGGRTGLSGGAVAAEGEVVLSLEKMNRIGEIDRQAMTVEVEAGAITEAVHHATHACGLTWPVDFASKGSSQVGGNLSTNAGGVRVIRYGLTRNWVLGLTAVTMDGKVLELNGALEKNNTGIDLRQLFIGSEGTLGVITKAVLKLCALPDEARTRVCFFAVRDFRAVLELFRAARSGPFTISAFECLSAACMREVRGFGLRSPFAEGDAGAGAGVYVLMEVEERDSESMEKWIGEVFALDGKHIPDDIKGASTDEPNMMTDEPNMMTDEPNMMTDEPNVTVGPIVLDGTMAQNSREREMLWALRERVAEAVLHRDPAHGKNGIVHQQDLSVPIAKLTDFFADVETRYAKAYPEFEVFVFGHIGDGNLHVFIRKPVSMSDAEFHRKCAASDTMLFELCAKYRGSVSAEHGVGVLKKPALHYSRSEEELRYLRALKQVMDPKGLLNPGKIF